jgi:hypothetical protein
MGEMTAGLQPRVADKICHPAVLSPALEEARVERILCFEQKRYRIPIHVFLM